MALLVVIILFPLHVADLVKSTNAFTYVCPYCCVINSNIRWTGDAFINSNLQWNFPNQAFSSAFVTSRVLFKTKS